MFFKSLQTKFLTHIIILSEVPLNSILLIAKKEFKTGLVTPKTSAIFFFFLLFMGWFFSNFIDTFILLQQQAPMMGGQAPTMEQLLKAMFFNLHFILILIVPAVTMGVFSEEKKNQSLRFLQTAPISAFEIVAGKYLSSCAVMASVLLLSFVYPAFLVVYGNPDVGVILSSYLGLFLLICAQLAFGLWVSSMTSNQFLAFLFTMLGLFLMLVLDFLAPNSAGGDVADIVIRYFATSSHLDSFFSGVISVADTFYFMILAVGFTCFSVAKIDSLRWR